MLYRFPEGLKAIVVQAYERPYADPVKGVAGDAFVPDFSRQTDIIGWIWCRNGRGQSGWVPQSWLERDGDIWRLVRDFDAIELTGEPQQVVTLHFSESGFCWVTSLSGATGWVPDAVLALVQ